MPSVDPGTRPLAWVHKASELAARSSTVFGWCFVALGPLTILGTIAMMIRTVRRRDAACFVADGGEQCPEIHPVVGLAVLAAIVLAVVSLALGAAIVSATRRYRAGSLPARLTLALLWMAVAGGATAMGLAVLAVREPNDAVTAGRVAAAFVVAGVVAAAIAGAVAFTAPGIRQRDRATARGV